MGNPVRVTNNVTFEDAPPPHTTVESDCDPTTQDAVPLFPTREVAPRSRPPGSTFGFIPDEGGEHRGVGGVKSGVCGVPTEVLPHFDTRNLKTSPASVPLHHLYGPPVGLGDLLADGQSKPGSVGIT